MIKKHNRVTFATIEEYFAFYAPDATKKQSKGSKYYRIGEDVARMACEKAFSNVPRARGKRAC
jgi:hypothetical protein